MVSALERAVPASVASTFVNVKLDTGSVQLSQQMALVTRILRQGGLSSFLDVQLIVQMANAAGVDLNFHTLLVHFVQKALVQAGVSEEEAQKVVLLEDQVLEVGEILTGIWQRRQVRFSDLLALAAALGLDQLSGMAQALVIAALKEAGLPTDILSALATKLHAITVGPNIVQELKSNLSLIVEHGFVRYDDLEAVSLVFNINATEVLNCSLIPILDRLGFGALGIQPLDDTFALLLPALKDFLIGKFSWAHIQQICQVLNLDIVQAQKPLAIAALTELGAPPQVTQNVQAADLSSSTSSKLQSALRSLLSEWSDASISALLEGAAEAFGMNLHYDLLKPLLASVFKRAGTSDVILEALGRLTEEEVSKLQVFISLLERQYPTFEDMQSLAEVLQLPENQFCHHVMIPVLSRSLKEIGLSTAARGRIAQKLCGRGIPIKQVFQDAVEGQLTEEKRLSLDGLLGNVVAFGLDAIHDVALPVLADFLTKAGLEEHMAFAILDAVEPNKSHSLWRIANVTLLRGHLLFDDLEILAEALGWGHEELARHVVQPIIVSALQRLGLQPQQLGDVQTLTDVSALKTIVEALLAQDIDYSSAETLGMALHFNSTAAFLHAMLRGMFSKACALDVDHVDIPIPTQFISELLPVMREGLQGHLEYKALKLLAKTTGISMAKCMKPFLQHLLQKVSAPKQVMELVESRLEGNDTVHAVETLLPALMKRRYFTFDDVEMLGMIFSFDPWILGDAEELAKNALRVSQQHAEGSKAVQIQTALLNIKDRGYPTCPEVRLVIEVFGLTQQLDEVMKQLTAVQLHVASSIKKHIREGPLHVEDIAQLSVLVCEVMERGYPRYQDAEALARIFGVKVIDDILVPLINRTLPSSLQGLPEINSALRGLEGSKAEEIPPVFLSGELREVQMEDLRRLAAALDINFDTLFKALFDAAIRHALESLPLVPEQRISSSKVQQVKDILQAMHERGYPIYSGLEILAGVLGLDAIHLIKMMLIRVLEVIGAPEFVIQTVTFSEAHPDETAALRESMPGMLKRGYPLFSDLEALAAMFQLDLMRDLVKPLIIFILWRVGVPQDLVLKIESFQLDEAQVDELREILPKLLKRGYPLFSELDFFADMFGVDPMEDFLQPVAVTALRQMGASQRVTDIVAEAEIRSEDVEKVRKSMILVRQRNYLTYSDFEVLAGIFGIDINEDLLKPSIITLLQKVNAPASLISVVENADIILEKVEPVKRMLPSMMKRGYPTCSDLASIAALMNKEVDQDFLQPLLAAAFQRVSGSFEKAEQLLSGIKCVAIESALENIMQRGYPSFADMKLLASEAGMDVQHFLALSVQTEEPGVATALLQMQKLVREGQALLEVANSESNSRASSLMAMIAALFSEISSFSEDPSEAEAEFEQMSSSAIADIGSLAGEDAASFVGKLAPVTGELTTILGMTLGDGAPICPNEVDQAFERFHRGLRQIKEHPTTKGLQNLADMLVRMGDRGYTLVDGIWSIHDVLMFLHGFAICAPPPLIPVSIVCGPILKGASKLYKWFKKLILPVANILETFVLKPGVKLGNAINSFVTRGLNFLEGVALALSNLLRPPAKVFQDIAEKLKICDILGTALPLVDITDLLLSALDYIPIFKLWPPDPFEQVPGFIFKAWKTMKRSLDTFNNALRPLLDFMDVRFRLCFSIKIYKKCWSFSVLKILEMATGGGRFKFLHKFKAKVLGPLAKFMNPAEFVMNKLLKLILGAVGGSLPLQPFASWAMNWREKMDELKEKMSELKDNLPDELNKLLEELGLPNIWPSLGKLWPGAIDTLVEDFKNAKLLQELDQVQNETLQGCVFHETGLADEDCPFQTTSTIISVHVCGGSSALPTSGALRCHLSQGCESPKSVAP